MFAASLVTALLALAVRADVTPSEPAPGEVFNAGANCHIGWEGSGDANWKGMYIQLMTGDNFNQIPLTTVATNQDGSTSGSFDYNCPQVTPNSAIYFYQFTSFLDTNASWIGTGRFAIASSTGQTTPPANSTQPPGPNGGPGASIPWGTGNLVDPTSAVAAPTAPAGSTSGTGNTTTPASTGSPTGTGTGTGTGSTTTPAAAAPAAAGLNSSSASSTVTVSSTSANNNLVNGTGTSAASTTNKPDSAALCMHPSTLLGAGVAALFFAAASW